MESSKKFVLSGLLEDLNGDDDRGYGLSNVLRMDFVGEFVRGRDFLLDRVLFFQNGIQMNFVNGRLGGLTYVLLLTLIEAARN